MWLRNLDAGIGKALSGALAVLLGGMLSISPVHGQNDELKVTLSADKTKPPSSPRRELLCRPNQERASYLWLQNPSEDNRTVDVELKIGDKTVASALDVKVRAGKDTLVTLGKPGVAKPAEAKTEAKTPTDAKAAEAKPAEEELPGPPYTFQIVVTEKSRGKKLGSPEVTPITVRTLFPSEYLEARPEFTATNVGQNVLTVRMRALPSFSDGPCQVNLVVPPDRNPGLVEFEQATTAQKLQDAQDEKSLVVKNIKFQREPTADGYFYVNADLYERAFAFTAPLHLDNGSIVPASVHNNSVRLKGNYFLPATAKKAAKADRYLQPAETLVVPIEADIRSESVNPDDVVVEVALDIDQDGKFAKGEIKKVPGHKNRRFFLRTDGPDGALVLRTEVIDWVVDYDIAGVTGDLAMRLRLLDRNGNEIRGVDDRGASTTTYETTVTIDGTKPQGVAFIGPEEEARADLPSLLFKATGRDPESGIKEVKFFVGPPIEEGDKLKAPKTVFMGKRDVDSDTWSAQIPLPDDKDKPFVVSVEFVNRAGLSQFQTAHPVKLVKPMPGAKVTTGTIKGTVKTGYRAEPGLEVKLLDSANAVKDTVKTNSQGEFTFEKVAPGSYTVTCADKDAGTKGQDTVKVEAEKTAEVAIKLALR